jgi:hypothetical protein
MNYESLFIIVNLEAVLKIDKYIFACHSEAGKESHFLFL